MYNDDDDDVGVEHANEPTYSCFSAALLGRGTNMNASVHIRCTNRHPANGWGESIFGGLAKSDGRRNTHKHYLYNSPHVYVCGLNSDIDADDGVNELSPKRWPQQ